METPGPVTIVFCALLCGAMLFKVGLLAYSLLRPAPSPKLTPEEIEGEEQALQP